MDAQTIAALGSSAAVVGALILWFFRRILPAFRQWSRRMDKIFGTPADPGVGQKAAPGIFERMDGQDEVLETIRHEVQFNNGSSVKDAVSRVEKALNKHLNVLPIPPNTTININGSDT